MEVDISFESMADFSPDAIAQKVESLRKLMQASVQLSNLVTYMDGKAGAEELVARAINDPALLASLVAAAKPEENEAAVKEESQNG